LQIARAYVMQGDSVRGRAAYEEFLKLWKDADPDIPIFKQAKAEYAKLISGSPSTDRIVPPQNPIADSRGPDP
jgi:hypothetical protein